MIIPDLGEAVDACAKGELDPLQEFIYYHQPYNSKEFRERLLKALEYVCHQKGAIY
jgi:hypothetical protein